MAAALDSWQVFGQMSQVVDETAARYVAEISSNAITTARPFVVVLLAIAFALYFLAIIAGRVQMPLMEFFQKSFVIAAVCAVALSAGVYQTHIAGLITGLPDWLIQKLLNDPNTNVASIVDKTALEGARRAGEAFTSGSWSDMPAYTVFGLIVIASTMLLVFLGAAFILVAKFSLFLLAAVGPFFVLALLGNWTKTMFNTWLGFILSMTLMTLFVGLSSALVMTMFTGWMQQLQFNGVMNAALAVMWCGIMSAIGLVVVWQTAGLAASLANGASVDFHGAAHGLREAAGHRARTDEKGRVRSPGQGAIGTLGSVRRGGVAAANSTWNAGRKAVGYLRA